MAKLSKTAAALLVFFAVALISQFRVAHAQDYNVLQECMKLSSADEDIHVCIDNYLDVMDDNITDISDYIARDLADAALDKFQLSQQAFFEFRKQNCLWYLEFSSPRSAAERIAKNCLATMSQQRLAELQLLIRSDGGRANTLRGFYVYGANRNSFQPCGSEQRYWIEGDNALVGQLQQDYLQKSTASLQVLYAELLGQIDPTTSYPEHSGIVRLSGINALKVPSDSECRLPDGATANTLASRAEVKPAAVPEPEETVESSSEEEIDQNLRAYFGDWLAECQQSKSRFLCELSVGFSGKESSDVEQPVLRLSRRADRRTLFYLAFPEREIDSAAKIRWRVDKYTFGDIVGSDIRVDEKGTQQLIHERKFIRDDLLPLLMGGTELGIEVLVGVDDDIGDKYSASLKGLTRALQFADDFVANNGQL